MATFRPSVNQDDGYFKKVVKYIPAEIIGAYTFCIGLVSSDTTANFHLFPWILFGLLVFTPVYMYLSVVDNPNNDPLNKRKLALFHSAIASIAFLIWIYALGDKPMIEYSKELFGKDWYNAITGSLILVAFSMIAPLLERLFIGRT
jgi:fucose 4-O-acetylase-like acetyltransferase